MKKISIKTNYRRRHWGTNNDSQWKKHLDVQSHYHPAAWRRRRPEKG